ncbi:intimin, partial [Escherichia coli 10.0833]
SMRFV